MEYGAIKFDGVFNSQDFTIRSMQSRSEELRFDSVVAVNPGKYDAVLGDRPRRAKVCLSPCF